MKFVDFFLLLVLENWPNAMMLPVLMRKPSFAVMRAFCRREMEGRAKSRTCSSLITMRCGGGECEVDTSCGGE